MRVALLVRIPFPIRIPVFPSFVFTGVLAIVQILQGTDPLYAALVAVFILLSVAAFNVVGGFSRPSGGYIAFYSLLVVDVGTVYKCVLGQPAQSNLAEPILLMATYVATMGGMLLAGFVSKKIATTKDGIAGVLQVNKHRFRESATGCFVIHCVIVAALTFLPGGGGQIIHSLSIIDPFLLLAALLGTIAAVVDSGGRRSMNLVNTLTFTYIFVQGLLSFSKQGMFLPGTCWLLGAAWARFRIRMIHVIVLGAYVLCGFEVFTPISASRDDVQTGTTAERIALVEHYFTHTSELRARANSFEVDEHDLGSKLLYYGRPQGLWDRLSMLPNDAMLISFSHQGHYRGYAAMLYYLHGLVPHILDSSRVEDKTVGGNAYAHEMGGLADADTSTGISFSPTAEAFHIDGWRGVLLLQPAVFMLLFIISDGICGDVRRQPLGLFLTLSFAHVAPEAALGGAVTAASYGTASVSVAVLVCGYITPIVGLLLSGQPVVMESPA